ENEARLKREIESIGDDRRKFNQQIIDTASRVVSVEERIAQTQERLEPLDDREQALRASLEERRGVIAEVLAALQRIGPHARAGAARLLDRGGGPAGIGAFRAGAGRGPARDGPASRGAGGGPRGARAPPPAVCRRARPPCPGSVRARGRAPTAIPVYRGAAKTIGGGGTSPHR